MKIEARSAALGALFASTLAVLVSAQAQEAPQEPAQPDPVIEALKALTAAQERQAAAWETLAEKGWPQPQDVRIEAGTYGGRLSPLHVQLSGGITTFSR